MISHTSYLYRNRSQGIASSGSIKETTSLGCRTVAEARAISHPAICGAAASHGYLPSSEVKIAGLALGAIAFAGTSKDVPELISLISASRTMAADYKLLTVRLDMGRKNFSSCSVPTR